MHNKTGGTSFHSLNIRLNLILLFLAIDDYFEVIIYVALPVASVLLSLGVILLMISSEGKDSIKSKSSRFCFSIFYH